MALDHSRPLTSDLAVCCWIPHFALRCEEARQPGFAVGPAAVLSPDDSRRVWQLSPPARRVGVRVGMTVGQAIGLCPTLRLCEPDPVHYDARFAALVAALGAVSPVLEPVEPGRVFIGTDGLEGLFGGPEAQIAVIARLLEQSAFPSFRLGWGAGTFVAWVAASRAKPGGAVIVPPGEARTFLAAQPLAVLPLDVDTHRRLRRLGLATLGELAALPEEAVASQFGSAGRRLWRLAAGRTLTPVTGRRTPEPIVASLTFFTPVGEREFLLQALTQLVTRALQNPRRRGWRVQVLRVEARVERGTSWLAELTLKEPAAAVDPLMAALRVRLDQAPPAGAVERLTLAFTAFAPGTTELQLFARDASAAARAQRRDALRTAAQEIQLRFRQTLLHHIIEVQPWSRLPERRYALIDFDP